AEGGRAGRAPGRPPPPPPPGRAAPAPPPRRPPPRERSASGPDSHRELRGHGDRPQSRSARGGARPHGSVPASAEDASRSGAGGGSVSRGGGGGGVWGGGGGAGWGGVL